MQEEALFTTYQAVTFMLAADSARAATTDGRRLYQSLAAQKLSSTGTICELHRQISGHWNREAALTALENRSKAGATLF